ncbi:MAG: MFS transporter [Cyanobacteriota bacterium]|nr:MFS transporter [Cyanobacteriota bacterium]
MAGLFFWASLGALLPTLPLYVSNAGGTSQDIGLVMGSFSIGLIASRSWLGRLSDRRSRKLVLLIGMMALILPPLGYMFINNVLGLMVIRALHGISIAAFATGYITLVVDISPASHRGEVLGYMSLVNPVGIAIGPAIGGLMEASWGYSPLFLFASGLGVAGFGATLLVREVASVPVQNPDAMPFWSLLQRPSIFSLTLVMLLIGLAFGTESTFVSLLIQEAEVDLNPGLFYTAAAFASFAIRLLTGRASDRYGRGLFITISLILYTVAMAILWKATSVLAFVLSALLAGAGFGILIPMVSALVADRSEAHERGRMLGLCMTGFDLGIGLAGPILGSLAISSGYRGMFGAATLLSGLAIGTFLAFSNRDVRQSLRFSLGLSQDYYATDVFPHNVEA